MHPYNQSSRAPPTAQLLLVMEGEHDLTFLRLLSQQLHAEDASLPDLTAWELQGKAVLLSIGGGNPAAWATRLAPLGLPEVHILDRELPPETQLRQAVVESISQRAGCRAFLTAKRSLENYLHPAAIEAVKGLAIPVTDDACLAEVLAREHFAVHAPGCTWEQLSFASRRRRLCGAKRWLNHLAVRHMTRQRLEERDPDGEVLGWLVTIRELAGG